MSNNVSTVLVGMFNQHQFWIKHGENDGSAEVGSLGGKSQDSTIKINSFSSGAIYGLGLIGAWIYYIGRAQTFRKGLAGFFKAFVWPVTLVYKLLDSHEGQ